jgi:hypothetical protein
MSLLNHGFDCEDVVCSLVLWEEACLIVGSELPTPTPLKAIDGEQSNMFFHWSFIDMQ